jgi:starvation-inducible DNA-binding protein
VKTQELHATHHDLRDTTRGEMVELLNRQLADTSDLKTHLKHAHWNVKGMDFFALHELFDKLAGEIEAHTDTIAERVTALGGTAFGTARQVAGATRLPEFPAGATDGAEHLQALVERYAALARTTRAAIDAASAAGDQDSADLCTEVSRDLDKHLWFLEAHLQGKGARR